MLTEKYAWLLLAGAWSNAETHGSCPYHCAPLYDEHVMGLCTSIYELYRLQIIDMDTANTMTRKLRGYGDANDIRGTYYWPRDQAGARERSLFCSSQAEAL